MKKYIISSLVLVSLGVYCQCEAKQANPNEVFSSQTQLQKRQYQTRTYENVDTRTVMKAMLNVLQDDSFVIANANPNLGFISGIKEFSPNDKTINFEKEFGAKKSMGTVVAVIDATANVSEFGKETRVRVTFKRKQLNTYGNATKIEEITEEAYYQNFFSKVDKGIFIQKEKI